MHNILCTIRIPLCTRHVFFFITVCFTMSRCDLLEQIILTILLICLQLLLAIIQSILHEYNFEGENIYVHMITTRWIIKSQSTVKK